MGVSSAVSIDPSGAQDPFFDSMRAEIDNKGFLLASADSLITWARTGSLDRKSVV